MEQTERYTIAALVSNEAGVLSQVSHLFSRKGYNIETLAVGCTENPEISRVTIEVRTDEDHVNLLCNQLRKLIPVYSVKLLDHQNSVRRELVLIKVNAPDRVTRDEVMQIGNIFRASPPSPSPSSGMKPKPPRWRACCGSLEFWSLCEPASSPLSGEPIP